MKHLTDWAEGGHLSREVVCRLEAYAALLHQWNPVINLTGYKSIPEIELHLIGESVAALQAIHLSGESVLDFGSGAGVPGLIWAICNPELKITSLEIRHKKVAFQKEVARTFSLSIEVVCGYFPEAVAKRSFDVIVSRAIRLDPGLWKQSRDLLKPSGRIIRFATPGTTEEGWTPLDVSERTTLLISC